MYSWKKFHSIFKEKFTQFFKKVHAIFKKISRNFQKNLTQFWRKIHKPVTHLSYSIYYFKVFREKEGEMWNIPLYIFCHFHEILILNRVSVLINTKFDKKPLTFHQETVTLSEMMWNMKCKKGTLVKCAKHILHTFHFFTFRSHFTTFRNKYIAG